ncbi:DUF6702 family protein [Zhouia amylolytica]|uniref:Peptidase E n=1 Tax=Zhouia amylolytica AD3 TaxID=1286632 RepID=W2UM48_9FLAO|nr:DUF6702 family protein [Zhouia amylolytica]ETN95088.1 hypothetical protein P278_20050 [Zhouia amylolytica AD3]
MKKIKKFILILILPLFAFTTLHKFYVSVTNINYSDQDKSLQIISRIFIDDFEDTLEERYQIKPKLMSDKEMPNIDLYIERYLKHHLNVKVNNKKVDLKYLGKEYDNDVVKCYIEIEGIDADALKSIEVENSLLFELFEKQNNIVHFKIDDLRKSFSLISGNDKALLNF